MLGSVKIAVKLHFFFCVHEVLETKYLVLCVVVYNGVLEHLGICTIREGDLAA